MGLGTQLAPPRRCPLAPVIQVILDYFRIHVSQIERVWEDFHANDTRNHRRPTLVALMGEVRYHLPKRNRRLLRQQKKALAIRSAATFCTVIQAALQTCVE